jgi:hypothetical protein
LPEGQESGVEKLTPPTPAIFTVTDTEAQSISPEVVVPPWVVRVRLMSLQTGEGDTFWAVLTVANGATASEADARRAVRALDVFFII